ncbi:hypothetical protein RB623_20945 [Mesorhizobium sp. LHD-90]|uniref:hypothetical protein n=1 Tax=Mesorhizobium sp. LHD-90 TaxID=3071414 RepID=UPI0027E0735E|nr:hypothetical protein [Mesorhizobium sp. LHD-90]MDQ6436525.1 hypothetical protein [Mesorhizobium sp. LHD-90]
MASRNQLDLFGADEPELFDEDAPTVYYYGDPDRVRAHVGRLIAEARAAKTVPWDEDSLRLYRKIVPQMVLWLPEDEARQLCFDFEEEMRRLLAA